MGNRVMEKRNSSGNTIARHQVPRKVRESRKRALRMAAKAQQIAKPASLPKVVELRKPVKPVVTPEIKRPQPVASRAAVAPKLVPVAPKPVPVPPKPVPVAAKASTPILPAAQKPHIAEKPPVPVKPTPQVRPAIPKPSVPVQPAAQAPIPEIKKQPPAKPAAVPAKSQAPKPVEKPTKSGEGLLRKLGLRRAPKAPEPKAPEPKAPEIVEPTLQAPDLGPRRPEKDPKEVPLDHLEDGVVDWGIKREDTEENEE